VSDGIEVIEFSESFLHIGAALSAAQSKFGRYKADNTAKVASDKATYTYKYADLGGLLAATLPALNGEGIALLQGATTTNESASAIVVETRLLHTSGEWIRTRFGLKSTSGTPQGVGSAVTYARRYALQSLLGVAPADDDDAQGASDTAAQAAQKQLESATQQLSDLPKKLHDARLQIDRLIAAKAALDQATIVRLVQEMTSSERTEWQSLDLPALRNFYSVLKAWKPQPPATNGVATPETALETRAGVTDDAQTDPAPETALQPRETLEIAGPAPLPADAIAYIEVELARLHLPEDVVMELTSEVSLRHDFSTYSWRELSTAENAKEFIKAVRKRAKELAAA